MKKLISFLLAFFIGAVAFCQTTNTITTDSVYQTGNCAGSQVIVKFTTTGSFPFGNTFTAQLSNAYGQFTNPVNIGSTSFNFGMMLATLPTNATFGFLYKIRVISSNPAVVGTPSPNYVVITSNSFSATITSDNGTTICPGDTNTLQVAMQANSYLWSTGDTTQAIAVTQLGTYSVKVIDAGGCEARDTMIITQASNCNVAGVYEFKHKPFKIYPNPMHANGLISFDGIESDWDEIRLIDITGRINAKIPSIKSNSVSLSSYTLPPGVYQLLLVQKEAVKGAGRLVIIE